MIKHEPIKSKNVCQLRDTNCSLGRTYYVKELGPFIENEYLKLSLCFILVREYLELALTLDKENL